MEDTNATGNYYCIAHIVQFTGLTDRTIRNYISNGILQGEKINGITIGAGKLLKSAVIIINDMVLSCNI